ncbi:Cdc7p-Dbf4p kinase complex regulatory subunit [Knufia obscura]|nr:Cdc7p-Dbf4p kinase complex regulatory subunit [Knufia obscura]
MATTTRRQPLMSIPNATNSPHRNLNNSGSKRSRAVANVSQQENEPPTKRQALEKSLQEPAPTTPRRQGHHESAEGRVFERGTADPSNNFQKKLVAARDRTNAPSKSTRQNAAASREVESIRQWQKHYRKLFPHFHIYFDSIPGDMQARFVRQITHLGATEEKFFSNKVTHIVTTRPVPSADAVAKATENNQTVNPAVLEIKNGRSTVRRDGVNANDILIRGQQMDMKIWGADKLNKILTTLFDEKPGQEVTTRANNTARATNDLVQVLKNEKLAAAAEKEQVGIPRELVAFRGPFIYVHDMDEKVKPIMIREYPKVARRQDGEWPQFRSASIGKCPFVEDPIMRKELERERAQQRAQQIQQQKDAQKAARSKSVTTSQTLVESAKMEPPRRTSPRKVLREANQNTTMTQPASIKPAQPHPVERQSSFPPMPEQPPVGFVKPSQMQLVREPSASGIQRSAMTSAIQSQMISSAAATGLKATTSREVNELKRKVLERTHTGSLSIGSISSSHQVSALAGALKNARAPAPQRAAKSRAQEKLGGIQEELDPYADDLEAQRQTQAVVKKRKPAKREPKPGYCENCHDKYDDFEDHVVSRKHRKFAMTQSNWEDLDALLAKLQAP